MSEENDDVLCLRLDDASSVAQALSVALVGRQARTTDALASLLRKACKARGLTDPGALMLKALAYELDQMAGIAPPYGSFRWLGPRALREAEEREVEALEALAFGGKRAERRDETAGEVEARLTVIEGGQGDGA